MAKKNPDSPKTTKPAQKAQPVEPAGPVPASRYVVSGRQLAEILAAEQGRVPAVRTIQSWVTEYGLPRLAQDRYDLPAVIAWRIGRIRTELGKGEGDDRRLLKAQADKEAARAKLLELEQRRRTGELLELAEVEAGRLQRIVAVRAGLRHLWVTLSAELSRLSKGKIPAARVKRVVEAEVAKLLATFAGTAEPLAAKPRRDRKPKPKKPKGKK